MNFNGRGLQRLDERFSSLDRPPRPRLCVDDPKSRDGGEIVARDGLRYARDQLLFRNRHNKVI